MLIKNLKTKNHQNKSRVFFQSSQYLGWYSYFLWWFFGQNGTLRIWESVSPRLRLVRLCALPCNKCILVCYVLVSLVAGCIFFSKHWTGFRNHWHHVFISIDPGSEICEAKWQFWWSTRAFGDLFLKCKEFSQYSNTGRSWEKPWN